MQPLISSQVGLDHAIELANRALTRVPAERDHVRANGHDGSPILDHAGFLALPTTDKAGYLRRHPIPALMWDGDITGAGTYSATSGSTGSPTFFPRDEVALDDAVAFYGRIFDESFEIGDHSTLVIVCFAMGTWIGGSYSYQAALGLRRAGKRISVTTPGIDVSAAVTNLVELGPHYEKVIVAGYPPLVKDVLDQTPESAFAQDIYVLLAGEAITEGWRDHLLERIGRPAQPQRVCLMYGTAEAGVMGHETRVTSAVRRAAMPGSALADALFGTGTRAIPTFVEVDLTRRYVEVDKDGYLLFTIDSALPLIRYRINDRGAVLTGHRLREILVACRHAALAERVDPDSAFIVLTGRPDVSTTFYALNIYPADFAGVFDEPALTGLVTGKFFADGSPGDDHEPILRVDVELAANAPTPPTGTRTMLGQLCRSALTVNNEEFRTLDASREGVGTTPRISLHAYGTGPFKPGIKHTYVGAK